MKRDELLAEAGRRLGRPVPYWVLRYALQTGAVSEPQRFGGWRRYTDEHVEQLLSYCRSRSRLVFSTVSAASNAI